MPHLKRIVETHRSYDPLQYPLLFPHGTDGYDIQIPKENTKKTVSAGEFYAYRIMIREKAYLLNFRKLLNVFLVDMYAKIEAERLLYIRLNQKRLRSENYIHLRDAYANHSTSVSDIGQMVILPSSWTGEL